MKAIANRCDTQSMKRQTILSVEEALCEENDGIQIVFQDENLIYFSYRPIPFGGEKEKNKLEATVIDFSKDYEKQLDDFFEALKKGRK